MFFFRFEDIRMSFRNWLSMLYKLYLQEPQASLIVPSKLTLIVRLEQYADQAKKGLFTPSGFPKGQLILKANCQAVRT